MSLAIPIRNLKEAMGILADYVSEISVEVKAIAQGDLTRNGNDITDFLGDFSELKRITGVYSETV